MDIAETHRLIIETARFIARAKGVLQNNGAILEGEKCVLAGQVVRGRQFVYCDKKVAIFASKTDFSLEIVIRDAVTPSGLSNPAYMVDDIGTAFRTHGEIRYVTDHLAETAKEIAQNLAKNEEKDKD